jgi:uncharacterized Zn finger protein
MERIAPGRFSVTISGEAQTVIVSFAARAEILRAITRKQLEYRGLSASTMLPIEMRAKLAEAVEALDAVRGRKTARLEAPEGGYSETDKATYDADDQQLEELQERVNKLYAESIDIIDANKDKVTETLTVGMIDLTDEAIAEILSILLTQRDDRGKPTTKVTKEEILYSPAYVDASDELLNLIEGVMEYLMDSLKKISAVSEMLTSLVRPN